MMSRHLTQCGKENHELIQTDPLGPMGTCPLVGHLHDISSTLQHQKSPTKTTCGAHCEDFSSLASLFSAKGAAFPAMFTWWKREVGCRLDQHDQLPIEQEHVFLAKGWTKETHIKNWVGSGCKLQCQQFQLLYVSIWYHDIAHCGLGKVQVYLQKSFFSWPLRRKRYLSDTKK